MIYYGNGPGNSKPQAYCIRDIPAYYCETCVTKRAGDPESDMVNGVLYPWDEGPLIEDDPRGWCRDSVHCDDCHTTLRERGDWHQ